MMDPTMLLSGTEAVTAFVQFGFVVVSAYHGAHEVGGSDEDTETFDTQLLLSHLKEHETRLNVILRTKTGCLNEAETHLEHLRLSCIIAAKNLRTRLMKAYHVDVISPTSAPVEQLWATNDIRALVKCLCSLEEDIKEQILPYLRSCGLEMKDFIQPSFQAEVHEHKLRGRYREDVGEETIEHAEEVRGKDEEEEKPKFSARASRIQGGVPLRMPQHSSIPTRPPPVAPSGLLQEFILEGLSFSYMMDREQQVSAAHKKTFQWILDDDDAKSVSEALSSTFPAWLTGNDLGSIYWINGKAGSGKSTLLRYIYDQETTHQKLRVWAGSKALTTAAFYFWTSGSIEQRSQAGLLRHLLFQLLDKHRHLIEVVFPELWTKLRSMTAKERIALKLNWRLSELIDGLRRFLGSVVSTSNVCLFIDGLDEFDGDHSYVIDLLRELVAISANNIKICLSSRPWPVFVDAFTTGPCLKLQDLTLSDMRQYVDDKLNKEPRVRRIAKKESQAAADLMEDVVQRADGVFLWIILAIRSLLADLNSADTISYLHSRLLKLPTDLDELFQHTLFDIQSRKSRLAAAKIFQFIRAREDVCKFTNDRSSAALTLWDIGLAQLTHTDVLELDINEASDEAVGALCDGTEKLINTICAGLLAIHSKAAGSGGGLRFASVNNSSNTLANSKVTFLHRTVRDWLMQSTTWNNIQCITIGTSFCPHISLLGSQVLKLRLPLEEIEHHRRLDEWWPYIVLALSHARYVSPVLHTEMTALVDKLNETISWYWESRNGDHWARNVFGSYEERNKAVISTPFLCLAVKFGLVGYMKDVLQRDDQWRESYEGGQTLLAYALEMLVSRRQSLYPFSSMEMVQILLEAGEGPNQEYRDFRGRTETPWKKALGLLREAERRGWLPPWMVSGRGDDDTMGRWIGIVNLLVDAGADASLVIKATPLDPEITAVGVFDKVLGTCGDFRVAELRDRIAGKSD